MEDTIRKIISHIGDNPDREGLIDTPKRVIKSWSKLYEGYKQNPATILATNFEDGACDEMVILKEIEFYSTCEHHILPFYGRASVGYVPDKKVVGISKLARLVDCYARRLQIQEKMTAQIADAIEEYLKPKGVIVLVEAQHFCMTSRGVEKQNSKMVTSAIRGVFNENSVRNEFLNLVK
jgi:GTP cyclohydrolase IA